MSPLSRLLIIAFHGFITGCSIYYHDPQSGEDHIWGIGHLAMKALPAADGKQAIARKTTLTGVSVGVEEGSLGLSVGWDRRERIEVFSQSTSLLLERPSNGDFFAFRIGTPSPSFPQKPPSLTSEPSEVSP